MTFNELVRRRMAFDRRPILRLVSDRVAVRRFVADRVGHDILPVAYAIVDDPLQIDRRALPREFVVKPNHGSGAGVFVTNHAPTDVAVLKPGLGWARQIVSPEALDWTVLCAVADDWLRLSYGDDTMEWGYGGIRRRILVEEFLGPDFPADFKFFVFHGVPRVVAYATDRFRDVRCDFYTADWELLDVESRVPRSGQWTPRPASWDRLLEVAARLGRGFDFIRVDLYDMAGRVVFGELTAYPSAGRDTFTPAAFDLELGAWWRSGRANDDRGRSSPREP
jgi:hypothetical protein